MGSERLRSGRGKPVVFKPGLNLSSWSFSSLAVLFSSERKAVSPLDYHDHVPNLSDLSNRMSHGNFNSLH